MKQVRTRRSQEGGFAVLMVFVLAAVVGIMLYMEMPRVAFESQRTKEQLLIDRGEQYKRAIQLFYRKNKRFPTTMDELEKFQEIRFLRQRYKDPMTGKKDDWRIIHVGPGGQLTDSLVTKQQNPLGQNGSNGANGSQGSNGTQGTNGSQSSNNQTGGQSNPGFSSSFGSQSSSGSGQPPPTQYNANGMPVSGADADSSSGPPSGINMAIARRPSDSMNLGSPGQGGSANPNPNGDPSQTQDPAQPPAQDPNQPPSTNTNTNTSQPYSQPQPGQTGYQPQQGYSQPQSGNNNGNNGTAGNLNTGSNSSNAASPNNPAGTNPALNAIQNSLFSARPQQTGSSFSTGNSPGGGVGIAGIATKYKGPAIKVVNERKKYQEWEFIYDMKKDKSLMGAAGVNALQNAQNPGQGQGQNAPGFSSFGSGNQNSTGSSFGSGSQNSTGSSFGNNSGSNSSSQSQTQPQQQPQQQ